MSELKILVGADPEIFMRKGKSFVSAHGSIQGDKKNPFKVEKGAVQVDGMALEFNIDPASNADEFADNINTVMGILRGMVPDFELVPTPVATFSAKYMASQPAEALELGCEPDYNAWEDGNANPRPNGKVNFRTGAGHVHIGWGKDMDINDPDHRNACIALAKQLDYYLGIGSLVYDKDTKRRTLYGSAGAYRPKSYGMEYRVLSNAWLQSTDLMKWVFNTTNQAVQDLFQGKVADSHLNYFNIRGMLQATTPRRAHIDHIMRALEVKTPPIPQV